jgi:hypothetical protein
MIKQLIAIMALAATAATAQAQVMNGPVVGIERETLGSGTPGKSGFEHALPVLENDIFHAPQYMAHHPTAATIWPRVVEVPCHRHGSVVKCEGYHWTPKMGRGEYLFFTPKIIEPQAPTIVEVPVPGPERIILKEVPIKKPRE